MVETRPSHSSDDLARRLDAIPDDPADTMFGLNQLSTMRLLQDHGSPFHVVSARFTGDLPADHEIGVRAATMVLGEFQEIISEVGAALKRESPRRGPLPAGILEATELRFAPQVLPGSVIFTLHPAREAVLFESGHSPLDDALTSIFSLFEKVERPAPSEVRVRTRPERPQCGSRRHGRGTPGSGLSRFEGRSTIPQIACGASDQSNN